MPFFRKTNLFLVLFVFLLTSVAVFSAPAVKLVFFHTSDTHGHISASVDTTSSAKEKPLLGGFAALATFLQHERLEVYKSGGLPLYVDSGDFFQGSPVVDSTKGMCMVAMFNQLNLAATTLGNHEFDYGLDTLAKVIGDADFPVICCNVFHKKTGKLFPFLRPYLIIPFRGWKIALIGILTPETAQMSFPKNVAGIDFRDPIPILNELVPRLRQKGVDAVVLLSHMGFCKTASLPSIYQVST